MNIARFDRRLKKWRKKKYGMRRDGDSVKLIQRELEKKSAEAKRKAQKQKENNRNGN